MFGSTSVKLAEVMEGVPVISAIPDSVAAVEVSGLAYDSRKAAPGFLFFAFPGSKTDGRRFATQALEKGAVAVISEAPAPADFTGHWIRTAHGRHALAIASGNFYNHPDRRLKIIGVTGTNGKTTTTYLIDSILRAAGLTTALVGTIEYRLAGRQLPSINTTPESLDLFEMFSELERLGGTHVTMETSSHALSLGRVYGVQFETAVFTNLTRDHLDFHGDMDSYLAAKRLLFTSEASTGPRFAVINHDDTYASALRTKPQTEVITYGLGEGASARAQGVTTGFDGLRFEIHHDGRTYKVESPLVGQINVYNLLAAWCAAYSVGIGPEVIARGIADCKAVPGRFERVDVGQPFLVVVDYAHTDDALRNLISIARGLTDKRVITLFGCGGDRDRAKRPLMGMAAAELSDMVILTSDNPRSEDPIGIMNDAMVGIRRFDTPLVIEPDREKAIRAAINKAGPGDIVLLAGKGHETYQVLKDKTINFDDREVARRILRGFGYGKD
jgi:UDP-N-acetylmuramoyl-L-alanyl-D-glutamate--2,6-diaminopimelate ligase